MRGRIRRFVSVLAAVSALALGADAAFASNTPQRTAPLSRTDDATVCRDTIAHAERIKGIPTHLMQSVAIAESGRYDATHKAVLAWPWTINAEGEGKYFPSKAAAIADVRRLQAQGVKSIDVGCMQINLVHHAKAFASLEQAFDPGHNVAYGAEFLRERYEATKSWNTAVAHYHSQTPERGGPYRDRVLAIWQKQQQGGASAVASLYRGAATPAPTAAPVTMVQMPQRWFPARPGDAVAQIQVFEGDKVKQTIPVTGPRPVRPTIIYAQKGQPIIWATPNIRITATR
jgi:hypothetical protein